MELIDLEKKILKHISQQSKPVKKQEIIDKFGEVGHTALTNLFKYKFINCPFESDGTQFGPSEDDWEITEEGKYALANIKALISLKLALLAQN